MLRESDPGTPDQILGQIVAELETRGVKIAIGTAREVVLAVVLRVLRGEDPTKINTTEPDVVADSAPMHHWCNEERELMANSLREHGGNYKDALVSLQTRLLQPHRDKGLTVKAASERCKQRYPHIF